jgi:hypothetical protein
MNETVTWNKIKFPSHHVGRILSELILSEGIMERYHASETNPEAANSSCLRHKRNYIFILYPSCEGAGIA